MAEELKPVNLPAYQPEYTPAGGIGDTGGKSLKPSASYDEIFNNLLNQSAPKTNSPIPTVSTGEIDMSGRYPKFFTGLDNEELYAQNQSLGEKAFNGVTKMTGIATSTFINGTVGLVNGIYQGVKDGKFSSFYDNDLSNSLNDFQESLNDKYAFYKTERERNGNWWEPSNLLSANFFFDNIVSNMGFALGAGAAGVLTGGLLGSALKSIAGASKLASLGVESAAAAESIIGEAATLSNAEALSTVNSRLNSAWTAAKSKIGAGLLKSDRSIAALTATAGEAGLEALSNSIQFRTQMVQEYKKNYGVDPSGDDLAKINESAESVGNFSFAANTALLTVTNYIQLPKIFSSSFKSERGILNGVAREAGEVVSTLPKKGFGKILYGGYKAAGALFSPAEAFEEGAQFAIQTGTQNYFSRKSKGQNVSVLDDAIGFGIKEALTTDEGLLNIFTGGLSGGLMTMGLVGMKDGKVGFGKTGTIGERGFFGYGGEQAKLREEAIPALQKTRLKQKLMGVVNNIAAAESIQEDRKEAVLANDKLESKDLEFDYAHTFISTRLKYGAEEMIYDEISELRQSAISDFTKLQKEGVVGQADDQQSFLNRLTLIESQTKHASQIQKALDLKYSGQVDKKGKRIYSDITLDKLVYAAAKINDYNHRIPQLSMELGKHNVLLESVLNKIIQGEEITPEEVTKEIADQLIEYQKTTQLTDDEIADTTQNGIDYVELGLRRKAYFDEYNAILKKPENFVTPEEEDIERTPEEIATENKAAANAPTVKIKTQKGDTDVELNKEYYLGNTHDTEKGNIFYDFIKFTILEVNSDGEIKIRKANGEVTTIPKDSLAKYKIGKVESVKNDKKALFFLENANNIFSFNFGKDKGGIVTGRLEYVDGKLNFVYKDSKNKIKRVENLNGQPFVAKKGFKKSIIEKIGSIDRQTGGLAGKVIPFTPKEQEALNNLINDKTLDPSVLEKVVTFAGTLEIVFDETLQTLEDTKQLIEEKTEELNKIEKNLAEASKKIEGQNTVVEKTKRFKVTAHRTIQAIKQLTKLRKQLGKELVNLKAEEEELEIRLEDILITAEQLQGQPGDYREMYKSIQDQRKNLDEVVNETKTQIGKLDDLINLVDDAIQSAGKAIKSLIDKFTNKYPNVPLSSNLSFKEAESILPYTTITGELFEDINQLDADIARIEEADIVPNDTINNELRDELGVLQEALVNYEKQLSSKKGTLSRLRELYKLHKVEVEKAAAVELEKELKINTVKDQFLGTIDNSVPTVNYDSDYEQDAKKSLFNVIRSTIAVTKAFLKKEETLRDHHIRVNKFGKRYEEFRNKEDIYGVLVSKANEAELGMEGLIDHMGGNDRTVTLVMVEEQIDGSLIPVNENGKPILNQEDRINQGIYQVRPDPKLTWSNGETMFRKEDESLEVEVRKIYAKEIDDILKNPSLTKYKITPSFGNVEYTNYPDRTNPQTGKPVRNREAKTTLKDAGLIKVNDKNDDLRERKVLVIPTTNDLVEKGSTSYSNALGRIFLDTGNAYVKLKNSQHSNVKATAIYDAVLRLAKIGKIKGSSEATELVSWLRTVIYWGTPKAELSHNSLFFQNTQDGLKLFISGKGQNIPFTPTSIKANRDSIIALIEEMYHNVNSRQATSESDYNRPYTEIISVSEDGKKVTREWPNYQSYLISDVNPDGSIRGINEIPLTTEIRPLENEEDSNREGIYFIMDDINIDEYSNVISNKQSKKVVGGKSNTPGMTAAQAGAASTAVPSEFILDGETENIITMFKGEVEVTFTANQDNIYNEDGSTDIGPISVIKGQEILDKKYNNDKDKIIEIIRGFIAKQLKSQVDNYLSGSVEDTSSSQSQQSSSSATTNFDLTGDTLNTITMLKGKVVIKFPVDANTYYDEEGIGNIKTFEIESGYDELQKKYPELNKDEIFSKVRSFIGGQVKPFLDEYLANQQQSPVTQEPVVSSAVPDEVTLATIIDMEETDETDEMNDINFSNRGYVEGDPKNRIALMNAHEEKFERENWDEIESWLKTAFPNVPVYRVKRMIQASNGRQAWGMYKDGAIYVYENALAGTAYHEVFEAIWDTLVTSEEKSRIYKEAKSRKGSFFDRETAKQVKYANATNHQIKEALAEEFIDYVRKGQKPVGSVKSFLEKIFDEIINFFKEMFFGEKGKNNTEKLFEKIGNGYYAHYNPYESKLSFAKAGFIDIENAIGNGNEEYCYELMGFTDVQWDDLMQQMTYFTVSNLLFDPKNPDKSIFDITLRKKTDLYDSLRLNVLEELKIGRFILKQELEKIKNGTSEAKNKSAIESSIKNYESLFQNIKNNWDSIVESHTDYLIPYEIDFDENDNAILRDESNSGKEDYKDANKIDTFKKASTAIKLFLATLPVVNAEGVKVISTVNGQRLQPLSKVKNDVQNVVDKARSPDEMVGNIIKLAKQNISYKLLAERITFNIPNFSLNKLTTAGQTSLITGLWKTFAKTNPEVKYVYILANGDVVIDDSNFSTAADQSMLDLEADLKLALTDPANKLFTYDTKRDGGGYFAKEGELGSKPSTVSEMIKFLKRIGIEFDIKDIEKRPQYKTQFMVAVGGIFDSFVKVNKIASVSGKSLEIRGRLRELAQIEAMIKNPEFDSTHYNINGELTQTFIGRNAHSDLFDMLSQIKNLDELQGTRYEYLMKNGDNFSQNSIKLAEMFNRKTGNVIQDRNPLLLKNGYLDGVFNSDKGKRVQSSRMNYRDRLVAKINLAIKGYYFNLVPGDGGMEHMTNMSNSVDISASLASQLKLAKPIFRGYFIDEVNVSREERNIVIPKGSGRKNTDLRFFKAILEDYEKGLHEKIVAEGNLIISPEELYDKYSDKIETAVVSYLEFRRDTLLETLTTYNLIVNESGNDVFDDLEKDVTFEELEQKGSVGEFNLENIAIGKDLSKEILKEKIHAITLNYVINTIEFHKLVYSDPYFYKDELKRVKNFNSPHQALAAGSASLNTAFDTVWNKFYKINKKPSGGYNNIGYTNFFNDSLVSATIKDVMAIVDIKGPWGEYGSWEEGDGGGMITFQALRKLRIYAGEWDSNDERQYLYDIAWEKFDKNLEDQLSEEEMEAYEKGNPKVQSAYTPYKPIANGNKKDGKKYNDILLDKFALFPISYRVMKELNKEADVNYVKLYERMQSSGVDYVVFKSARKVGSNVLHDLYNEEGNFVTDSFGTVEDGGISIIPLGILSNQTDVPTKESSTVTTGSQSVKLMTLDLMEGGVPVDFMPNDNFTTKYQVWIDMDESTRLETSKLYKEIKHNQKIVEALIKTGIVDTMKRLGITKIDNKYVIEPKNRSKAYDTLREEMLKREVNSNTLASLSGFLNGETILEATPAYRQIKNILYSIADKNIVSRTITGSQKVQMPSTLLESIKGRKTTINGKEGYTSDILKFYNEPGSDGKPIRVCEVMVRRWFDSTKTDEELINYFNNNEKGRSELSAISGIAFRTPTQKQNSIDAFRIAKFLPKEVGDVVVIPSALVKKVGSDFDIDKLSMYFKNLRLGKNGYPEVIKYLTEDNSTVQERYYNWVIDNADRDVSKYIRFLAKSEIANLRKAFKAQSDSISKSYKDAISEIKQTNYDKLLDKYDFIKKDLLSEQDFYMDELFTQGSAIFKTLSKESRDKIFDLKNRIAILEIKGAEEIRRYLVLSSILSTQDTTSNEDKKILNDMISNYEQELRVLGATQIEIEKANAEALSEFIKNKSVSIKSIGEFVSNFRSTEVIPQQTELRNAQNLAVAIELAEASELDDLATFERYPIEMQNTKKALQNAYIQSSENLVTSEENYDQLTKPNSADELVEITIQLLEDMGKSRPDYSKVDTMLSLEDMARIRYNLVTGKQIIGIAAVGQTNHAMNQRLLFTVDPSRRSKLPEEDKKWIGDALLKFKKFNSVIVNGEQRSTLSMIKDADNNMYISDINGMVIDGSVDISKDDWLMQLGVTPQTVATFLYLVKSGVPVKDVVYFMNQPIIRDYLRMLETKGYSYLYIEDYVDELETSSTYGKGADAIVDSIPSFDKLQEMIKKDKNKLTDDEAAMQKFMLREFLKYSKMAQQLYYVSQGTNFDTANLNDPFLVYKKMLQLDRAKNTIFSDVDEFLKSSFLGVLSDTMEDVRDAIAALLPSDQGNARTVLEKTLLPYVDLPDHQFIRIAQTAVSDLFDWVVQNNEEQVNAKIERILVNKKGTASQVMSFINSIKEGHPLYQNVIIDSLGQKPAEKERQANNLYIKNKANKVYDENKYIYAFSQIKEYLKNSKGNEQLYDDLVSLSILQSGLRTSAISFTSLLPYEDFKNKYAETLSYINDFSNLDDFNKLDVFARNNWNNPDIVPSMKASYVKDMYNPLMNHFLPKEVKSKIQQGKIPFLLQVSINSIDAKDVVTYSFEKGSFAEKKKMRKNGNYSYIKKGLFKKVYLDEAQTQPLIKPYTNPKNGKTYLSYVYKMINAWGQGINANELYMEAKPSVFDNGYLKVKERTEQVNLKDTNGVNLYPERFTEIKYSAEVSDSKIVELYKDFITLDMSPNIETSQSPKKLPSDPKGMDPFTSQSTQDTNNEIKPNGRPAVKSANKNSCG